MPPVVEPEHPTVHRTIGFLQSIPAPTMQESPTPKGVGLSWQITVIRIQNQNKVFAMNPLVQRGFIYGLGGAKSVVIIL